MCLREHLCGFYVPEEIMEVLRLGCMYTMCDVCLDDVFVVSLFGFAARLLGALRSARRRTTDTIILGDLEWLGSNYTVKKNN